MGEALRVVGAKVGETVRFVGRLGEPGFWEDAGKEGLEWWHAAANYADLELDAPVERRGSVWVALEWMKSGRKLTPRGARRGRTMSRR